VKGLLIFDSKVLVWLQTTHTECRKATLSCKKGVSKMKR